MSTEVIVALISSPVLVAGLGAWVEMRKTRRANEHDHAVVLAKLQATQDDMAEVKTDVHEMRAEQNRHGQRLATIEARFDDHLLERGRR